ncbi:DUF3305 domain-containing protein [uncultured Jannaschia sp.]|uniref:DUF3305 domain-containing protein n=1 Tax=uncultured Jannaschia sp. TaxID=293347 RepID=UPI002629A701|nr:DUF3305 domain-containing protein [uncultured Jannaschia sp.]
MHDAAPKIAEMPVGVLIRRSPGVTRWMSEVWTLAGIVPHAGPAQWKPVFRDGPVEEFHATTLVLQLHRKDTDSLIQNLTAQVPSVWVALHGPGRPHATHVTASPFEASFHEVDAEDRVEKVAMPGGMIEWVEAFVALHHVDEPFVKRQRDRRREGAAQDGVGDPRIAQEADVWRNPQSLRSRK